MSTYIIGDLHGHYRDYQRLLKSTGLCDENLQWTGGEHHLWLIGDFFDRGASGINCVNLTMSLQEGARKAGGDVNSLLGNHELMILCAYKFGDARGEGGLTVMDQWLRWGGIESDLEHMNESHVQWLSDLPAMVKVEDALLLHADAMLYVEHGITVDAVNQSFINLTRSDNLDLWLQTLRGFSEHMAFSALGISGSRRAKQLLGLYRAKFLVHGHTPIPYARQVEPETVDSAWLYADGQCVNVDGGMYMGGPGFVYELSQGPG